MPAPLLVAIVAAWSTLPQAALKVFAAMVDYEDCQISVDNGANRLGQDWVQILEEWQTYVQRLQRSEAGHHAAHFCRSCQSADKIWEAKLLSVAVAEDVRASAKWVAAFNRLAFLKSPPLVPPPWVLERCRVCLLRVGWRAVAKEVRVRVADMAGRCEPVLLKVFQEKNGWGYALYYTR